MTAQILSQGQIIREYRISASGSASTAQQMKLLSDNLTGNTLQMVRVILEARSTNIIFAFGNSSVAASATVTSNVLPDGNIGVPSGALIALDINGLTQNYVSVIAESSTGTGIVRVMAVPTWRTL